VRDVATACVVVHHSRFIPFLHLSCMHCGLFPAVLRLYNLPPRFDESLALLATDLMPWAALIHLLVAVWMYGNNDVLLSDVFSTSLVGMGDENTQAAYDEWKVKLEVWDPLGVVPRLVRANVLPLVLLSFGVLVWLIFGNLLKVRVCCPGFQRVPCTTGV